MSEHAATDDEDVTALTTALREHLDAREAAWLEVLHGGRSVDVVADERRRAGDDDVDIVEARALFAPMDADDEAALVDALLEARTPEHGAANGPSEHTRVSRVNRWIAPVLAVAAMAVLVWWLIPGPSAPHAGAPLVAYGAIETDGGLVTQRGDDTPKAESIAYRASSPFQWVLRPAERTTGMGARAFASAQGGESRRLPIDAEVDVGGAVRFAGRVEQLGLTPGAWTIVIVVGDARTLPEDGAAAVELDGRDGWVVRRLQVVIEP